MTDWQPIETAPKDGTPILVAGGVDDNGPYAPNADMLRLMHAPTRAMWCGETWLIALAEACYVGVVRESPTHWMALPAPPNPTP